MRIACRHTLLTDLRGASYLPSAVGRFAASTALRRATSRAQPPSPRRDRDCGRDRNRNPDQARGFSSAVAFTRRGWELEPCDGEPEGEAPVPGGHATMDEESLEASWERMQRSVRAGTAKRMDVQMQMHVTP